jgi:hypothetical protein
VWHKQNTLPYFPTLGKIGMLVCSKILGIGSAERNWGAVKHLKTNKRSHLSGEKIKMQATIFGHHCAEKARFKREASTTFSTAAPDQIWNEEDFQDLGLTKLGVDLESLKERRKSKRFFGHGLKIGRKRSCCTTTPSIRPLSWLNMAGWLGVTQIMIIACTQPRRKR